MPTIWGFRRQSGARGTNTPVSEALINAVDDLFHHTLLNNTQITARLLERGLPTTGRQARSIRQRSGSAARPKPAANTAHQRRISEAIPRNKRPIARQARPEPAEGDAQEDRQGGMYQRRCCCQTP
jgi:hypothetical protein